MLNPYVNPLASSIHDKPNEEQELMHDLASELVNMHGMPVKYLSRKLVNYDANLFGEDPMSIFNDLGQITVYPDNPKNAYEGSEIFSKFGIQISQRMRVHVAVQEFREKTNLYRPQEGDVIFVAEWKKYLDNPGAGYPTDFLKIVDVNYDGKGFMPIGDFYFYTVDLEMWNYNQEKIVSNDPTVMENYQMSTNQDGLGNNINEPLIDNKTIQDLSDAILDWSENHPFGRE